MQQKTDKKVYEEHIVTQEGEVIQSKTIYKGQTEPSYVKLYLDCLLTFKGLAKGLNPILLELLRYMSYADVDGEHGGQIIYTNRAMKKRIADNLGVSVKRIEQVLTQLIRANIFSRIDVGTYQVNPSIFGKGEWKDIKNIRATFDFNSKEVTADIVKYEEEEMSRQQEELQQQAQEILTNAAVNTAASAAREENVPAEIEGQIALGEVI